MNGNEFCHESPTHLSQAAEERNNRNHYEWLNVHEYIQPASLNPDKAGVTEPVRAQSSRCFRF
jgi:hypothetical protein